ncbi:MAG: FtsX-like permease family protein [Candidatus Aminicenantes bacterium]|nr:FtsX-like permease family protein [Candidatus Aminicenantes bacterium]
MFKNYLKITLRIIKRYKGYSFINITGLAVGLACCILILLWVRNELSYDTFHEKGERIFKVTIESHQPDGRIEPLSSTQFPLAPALKERYPDIQEATRIFKAKALVRYGAKAFNEDRFFFTNPSFFEMFTFPLVRGNPQTALSGANSIVITENMAQKYFGNKDPIGKVLAVNVNRDFVVTGVMKNIPANSHIQFDFLVPGGILENLSRKRLRQEWDASGLNSWGSTYVDTYVMTQEFSSFLDVEQKISGFLKEVGTRQFLSRWMLRMQPLFQVYLFPINGSNTVVKYLTIFTIIALVVLMIACINFMNLTTAHSSKRAQEIGMRKVVGARRGDIVKQFVGEAFLISLVSSGVAVFLVSVFLPVFNILSGKQLSFTDSVDLSLLLGLLGITALAGGLSAIYPALFLSSFRPIEILKGSLSSGLKKALFRRVLVVVQFSLSIIFIIGTIVIYSQLEYMRKKDLGYNKENLIYLSLQGDIQNKYQLLKNELVQSPNVMSATASNALPLFLDTGAGGLDWEGKDPKLDASYNYASVDFDFIDTFQMEIVLGRNFSKEVISDTSNYILNETAINEMSLSDPIGKWFSMWDMEGKIIGVVKDFNFKPLRTGIKPLILTPKAMPYTYLIIRIPSKNYTSAIKYLEGVWKRINPEYPFDYHFLDEDFDRLYWDEQRLGKIFGYFSCLAIFIACLGLYGLAAFVAEQKTKEIGIRKVLGASILGITVMLSKEFTKWVLLANVIAWPVAYFVMHMWLQNFAYRTHMRLWAFILSAALTLIIAILTVSYQSLKAAAANPVDSLRNE